MGKVMRHTLGASLNIRHNLSSSKGPKPLQRSEERFSRNAETDLVCRLLLEKKKMYNARAAPEEKLAVCLVRQWSVFDLFPHCIGQATMPDCSHPILSFRH